MIDLSLSSNFLVRSFGWAFTEHPVELSIFFAFLILLLYEFASFRLRQRTEFLREGVVERAELLAADEDFPDELKPALKMISNCIDQRWRAWHFVRFFVWRGFVSPPRKKVEIFNGLSDEHSNRVSELVSLAVPAMLSNSLMATTVFCIVLPIQLFFVRPAVIATRYAILGTSKYDQPSESLRAAI